MELSMGMETIAQLQEKLKRYCLFLTENHWDAEDLAQETWVKAFGGLKVSNHTNPQALLFRIAKNSWIDHTRRSKFQLRYIEQAKKNFQSALSAPVSGQLEMIFLALLKNMTPLQRAVFLLKDVYDYSIVETAHIMNTTQGAVKAVLHRARQACSIVKRDLEEDALAAPQEGSDQSLLRSLAVAYECGDVAKVLALAMDGEVEATTALAIARNQIVSVKRTATTKERNVYRSHQSMAA